MMKAVLKRTILMWCFATGFASLVLVGASFEVATPFWKHLLETVGVGLLPVATFLLIYEFDTRKVYQQLVSSEFSQAFSGFGAEFREAFSGFGAEFREAFSGLGAICADCWKAGVISVDSLRPQEQVDSFFTTARQGSVLRLLGIALLDFIPVFKQDELVEATNKGAKVRCLYLDPDSQAVQEHAKNENRAPEEVANDIRTWENTSRAVQTHVTKQGAFTVKKYSTLPKHFLLITEDAVCVGHYLAGSRGNKCPHIVLRRKKNPLAEQFVKEFDQLWDNAKPV
jgi:hypothetical protein